MTARTDGMSQQPERWAPLLARIADEIEPTPTGFLVAGQSWAQDPADPRFVRRRQEALTQVLYQCYYQHHDDPAVIGGALDAVRRDRRLPTVQDVEWLHTLRVRLAGRFAWEGGWTQVDRGPTHVRAVRSGVTIRASVDECRWVDAATGTLAIRIPADRPHASPGFFLTVGRHGAGAREALVRTYLNLSAERAVDAFAGLVEALDDQSIPFSAKLIDHLDGFDRPDTAVVYADRALVHTVVRHARDTCARARGTLRPTVPAFTLPLAPGLAIAEQPLGREPGRSFGSHRCALLASALLRPPHRHTGRGRLDALVDALHGAGLDPARLHLNPGSPDLWLGPHPGAIE